MSKQHIAEIFGLTLLVIAAVSYVLRPSATKVPEVAPSSQVVVSGPVQSYYEAEHTKPAVPDDTEVRIHRGGYTYTITVKQLCVHGLLPAEACR